MSRRLDVLLGKYDKNTPQPVIDLTKGGMIGYAPNRMLPVIVPQPSEMYDISLTSPYGSTLRAVEIRHRLLLIVADVLQLLPRAKEEADERKD